LSPINKEQKATKINAKDVLSKPHITFVT